MKTVSPAKTCRLFRKVTLLITIGIGLLGGCSEVAIEKSELPDVLNVGFLPDDLGPAAMQHHLPLMDYLAEELGFTYEIIIPKDYADTVRKFAEGKLDLAYLGGLTFLQANHLTGAKPMVTSDVDTRFTSYLITRAEDKNLGMPQFEGKILSFGPTLSTSGHLMPRHILHELIGSPEEFFSQIIYSNSHDQTVYAVRDGKAKMGAVSREIVEKMYRDGRINSKQISIWRESPPFPDNIWTAHPSLGKAATGKLRDAFLSLTPSNQRDAEVLAASGAGGFLPSTLEDFSILKRVALEFGLLDATQ